MAFNVNAFFRHLANIRKKTSPAPEPQPSVRVVTIRVFAADGTTPVDQAAVTINWEDEAHVLHAPSDAFGRAFFTVAAGANCALQVSADRYVDFPHTGIGLTTDFTVKLAAATAPVTKRTGLVRVSNRALVDDQGALPALLTTLFPAVNPTLNDPEFATIAAEGCFHGYRSGTGFAGNTWTDRMADPRDVGAVAAMADRGYDLYGLRAMHCIFMDGAKSPGMESQAARIEVVRAFAAMLKGREHKFLAVEIVNERDNGDKLTIEDTRELGMLLQSLTPVLVILSRQVWGAYAALYRGTGLALATAHLERDNSADGGFWEHLSKAIEFPFEPADPTAEISGEPKGPGSSGMSEYNVLRLVMGYLLTLLEGLCGHVFHTGPGLRLGGAFDVNRLVDGRHIPAHLKDLPEWAPVCAGFRAVQQYMPADVANWGRWKGHWGGDNPVNLIPYRQTRSKETGQVVDPATYQGETGLDNGPFDDGTFFKAYVVARGNQVFVPVLRINRPFKIAHKSQACKWEVLNPLTGDVLAAETHAAGEWMTVTPRVADGWQPDGDGLVLRGELL